MSGSAGAPRADEIEAALAGLSHDELRRLARDWQIWARDDQLPPAGAWRTWLVLGGRGAGKTRAGAEWIRAQALGLAPLAERPARRIALIGETLIDARRVMVEGVSGLLAVHADDERPAFEASKLQLTWPNGAVGHLFSADNADSLRGPQFEVAWADELAKWRNPQAAWDMLQLGLRLGDGPRAVVTTTPRPIPLLKALLADESTATTRAATADNADNLAPGFVEAMLRRYRGSRLARQELEGLLIEDVSGALWRRDWIDTQRMRSAPELARIVVAVDPPVTATAASDACGIIVAGRGEDGRAYVLSDRTVQGREPVGWARAAVAAYRDFAADRVVAEVNQGGDMVVAVLRQVEPEVPVRKVSATRGKWLRAEPVAALYAEGRVVHVGSFDALEDQMCAFGGDGQAQGRSPDRLDALVWALTDLMLGDGATRPGIRQL